MQGGYPPDGNNYPPPPGGYGAPPPGAFGAPPAPNLTQANAPWGIDPVTGMPYSDKQKMVAGLLQIFLGSFGVGRFYLGYTALGLLQLFLGWMTCGIWPIVDGIMMLMGKVPDAQGRPLRD